MQTLTAYFSQSDTKAQFQLSTDSPNYFNFVPEFRMARYSFRLRHNLQEILCAADQHIKHHPILHLSPQASLSTSLRSKYVLTRSVSPTHTSLTAVTTSLVA